MSKYAGYQASSRKSRNALMHIILAKMGDEGRTWLDDILKESAQRKIKNPVSSLSSLSGMGYIQSFADEETGMTYIAPTNTGACYFEIDRDEWRVFWMRSVLIPVLLSVVTTFVTYAVTNYVLPKTNEMLPIASPAQLGATVRPSSTNTPTGYP